MKGTTSLMPGLFQFVMVLVFGLGASYPSLAENFPSTADFTCPGSVNVSLQDGCQVTMQVKNVLLGDQNGVDLTQYHLVIKDGVPGNGPVVDGCGTYEYTVTGPDNFSCWGFVTAEDKTPPTLYCPDDVAGIYKNEKFYPFFCTDVDTLAIKGVAKYVTDAAGTVLEISPALKKILDVTGYPTIVENCGNLTIEVRDEIIDPDDACKDITIVRTFTAYNTSCANYTAGCSQKISFTRPNLDDVIEPAATVEFDCTDELKLDDNGNPHPSESGYPKIRSPFGVYKINNTYCNLGASYTDGDHIVVCQGTYKFVRTWQVIDWCDLAYVYEFTQIIIVSDTKGPLVKCDPVDYDHDGYEDLRTFSTGPYDCTAAFEVPMPLVEDNCSDWKVLTEILAGDPNGPVVATILPGKSRYVSGIPVGCHVLRYTVTDDCGNKTVKLCPFQVEDQVAPVAVCDDDLNVSLGGQGYARVSADDIDEGSSDNCGLIRIEVRRRIVDIDAYECLDLFDTDGNGVVLNDEVRLSQEFGDPDGDGFLGEFFYYTPWQDYAEFTCCDMNENVRIELRVWDDRNRNGFAGDTDQVDICFKYDETRLVEDNFNVCWLDVLIEDKVAPVCTPPLPVSMDCNKLPYDFDPADEVQMTALFGAPEGYDNCPGWTVEELDPVTDNINDCGAGYFTRRFVVTDAKGIKSATCEQLVSLRQIHDYWIKFPADAQAQCGDPMPDTVTVKEDACDLLAISVKDDFFSASGDECYKIFRTYSVINWCEYDGESDPVVVSRDEDCDGYPGDEDVYVIVKTRKGKDPCYDYYGEEPAAYYQHVWYDRDSNPFNLLPIAGTKGKTCDYETNPFGFWKELTPITENEDPKKDTDNYPKGYYGDHCDDMASVGYWQYTQVIKVYDNVNPVITWEQTEPFCSYSSDFDNGCPAEATIGFTVDENCSPEEVTIKLYLDAGRDGVVEEEITSLLQGSYPNYWITSSFALGEYYLGVVADDGCGNKVGVHIPFEIADCKAPTPICLNGLAVELMPVIPADDVDGDGSDDDGAVTIWASDFIASPSYDCTGEVTYSINRSEGGIPSPDNTAITLTCNDPPNTLIQIWAYDGAGNSDLCETYVLVQNNIVQCSLTSNGAVAGVIAKESADAVQDVQVSVSGMEFMNVMSDVEGRYRFDGLAEGFDYTLNAYKNDNPLNGVSTFDLVVMSKHILGIQPLNSPYKLIAADVNNSGSVTAMDAISLRRIVLNIDLKFSNNTSWRFVPANYKFPNPANPWQNPFLEVLNINQLEGILADQAFVAIKIGDLNNDAKGNARQSEARSLAGRFSFQLEEQELRAGSIYRVPFRSDELQAIQGFQGTIGLDKSKVELVDIADGLMEAANFGFRLLDEGLITTSWNLSGADLPDTEKELFTLVLRAKADGLLSEALSFNSRQAPAEAYDQQDGLMEVGLDFDTQIKAEDFALYQNTPNPFGTETQIGFYLPNQAEVSLRIQDAGGRLLKLVRQSYSQGSHSIAISRSDLPAAGVLYYTLTSGEFTATKKMILID